MLRFQIANHMSKHQKHRFKTEGKHTQVSINPKPDASFQKFKVSNKSI